MTPSIESCARLLARDHMARIESTEAVYWSPDAERVVLLEVDDACGAELDEVLFLAFRPDPPGIPYTVVQTVVHPNEWRRIRSGDMRLPEAFGAAANLVRIAVRDEAGS